MEVYQGYQLFRRYGGIIALSNYLEEEHRGEVIWDESRFRPIIFFNENDPLEEKVKTLIHEFIHLAPKYLKYAARGEKLPHELEDEIERKTLDFYVKEPLFVWYFMQLVLDVEKEAGIVCVA